MKWLALILVACAGCANAPRATPDSLNWNSDCSPQMIQAWRNEIQNAYGDKPVFIFSSHGGSRDGEWVCKRGDDATQLHVPTVAWVLHDLFGDDYRIMLLVCNPAGHHLFVPGVLHSHRVMWLIPGKPEVRLTKDGPEAADWNALQLHIGATTQPSN